LKLPAVRRPDSLRDVNDANDNAGGNTTAGGEYNTAAGSRYVDQDRGISRGEDQDAFDDEGAADGYDEYRPRGGDQDQWAQDEDHEEEPVQREFTENQEDGDEGVADEEHERDDGGDEEGDGGDGEYHDDQEYENRGYEEEDY